MQRALTIAAEGGKADIAKPFKGVDGGVFEIALKHRGDAYRAIYAVRIGEDVGSSMRFKEIKKRDRDATDGCGPCQRAA